jgi:hypothetical protein
MSVIVVEPARGVADAGGLPSASWTAAAPSSSSTPARCPGPRWAVYRDNAVALFS